MYQDERIRNDIQEETAWDPRVKTTDIAVDGDKVTLTGSIKADYEKDLIEIAAWSAPGVMQVVDHLRVDSISKRKPICA